MIVQEVPRNLSRNKQKKNRVKDQERVIKNKNKQNKQNKSKKAWIAHTHDIYQWVQIKNNKIDSKIWWWILYYGWFISQMIDLKSNEAMTTTRYYH